MPDHDKELMIMRVPTPGRPLSGLTILVVEDSRLACDAIRLLCLRAGARIRRADCVRAARRHLQTYRPSVVICDLGLPDAPGYSLISELSRAPLRPPAILGMSGDPDLAATSVEAGADGFLVKPVESLSAFQAAVLAALPAPEPRRAGLRLALVGADDTIVPDALALRDDLAHAAEALDHAADRAAIDYVARFVRGVARIAHDGPLEDAASALVARAGTGRETRGAVRSLTGLVRERIAAGVSF
ncbi:MAG: response regulator [Paracoccaceae bacterium]